MSVPGGDLALLVSECNAFTRRVILHLVGWFVAPLGSSKWSQINKVMETAGDKWSIGSRSPGIPFLTCSHHQWDLAFPRCLMVVGKPTVLSKDHKHSALTMTGRYKDLFKIPIVILSFLWRLQFLSDLTFCYFLFDRIGVYFIFFLVLLWPFLLTFIHWFTSSFFHSLYSLLSLSSLQYCSIVFNQFCFILKLYHTSFIEFWLFSLLLTII